MAEKREANFFALERKFSDCALLIKTPRGWGALPQVPAIVSFANLTSPPDGCAALKADGRRSEAMLQPQCEPTLIASVTNSVQQVLNLSLLFGFRCCRTRSHRFALGCERHKTTMFSNSILLVSGTAAAGAGLIKLLLFYLHLCQLMNTNSDFHFSFAPKALWRPKRVCVAFATLGPLL